MSKETAALRVALDILHMPTQVRFVKEAPLPDGITELLRVAAGDTDALHDAAQHMQRPQDSIQQAANFFVEQILLAHDADSYRVLGVARNAPTEELRRNMALIMKHLHPDLDTNGDRSALIARATTAWNNLKTPDKRAAYDRQLPPPQSAASQSAASLNGHGRGQSGRRHAPRPQHYMMAPGSSASRPTAGPTGGKRRARKPNRMLRRLAVLFSKIGLR